MEHMTCVQSKSRLHSYEIVENCQGQDRVTHYPNITVTSPAYIKERCERCGHTITTITRDDGQPIDVNAYARHHIKDFLQPNDWRYSIEYPQEEQTE